MRVKGYKGKRVNGIELIFKRGTSIISTVIIGTSTNNC